MQDIKPTINPIIKIQLVPNNLLTTTLHYQIQIKTSISATNDQNISNMILVPQSISKQQQ